VGVEIFEQGPVDQLADFVQGLRGRSNNFKQSPENNFRAGSAQKYFRQGLVEIL
jgi:hypothetical protein